MGKKIFNRAALATGALMVAMLFHSCKEKGVIVDMGNVVARDTSYTAAVETPQQRMVLMEEFTGVSCPPCPSGHQLVKSILSSNPGKVAVVGIQAFGFIQANPVIENGDTITRHDNRTDAGTSLSTNVFGKLNQTPTAGIDRILYNGNMYIDKSYWVTQIGQRLAMTPNANVTVTSAYNSSKSEAVITVKVAYTSAVAKKQVLTVALIEDGVIDAQENGLDIDTNYEHEHVLRDILTTPTGSTMLSNFATKQAGLVYERVFVYDLSNKPLWNLNNMKVVAWVSNAESGDKEVQQAAQVTLK